MPMNMSYCRFQNTLEALQECLDALDEIGYDIGLLDSDERRAAKKIAHLCQQFAFAPGVTSRGEPL